MTRLGFYRDLASFRRKFSAATKRFDAAIATLENSEDPAACGRASKAALLSSAALASLDRDLRDLLKPADRHSDASVSCDGPKAARAAIADTTAALGRGEIDSHQADSVVAKARAFIDAEDVGRLPDRIKRLEQERAILRLSQIRVFGLAPADLTDEGHAALASIAEAVKRTDSGLELVIGHDQDELSRSVKIIEAAGADLSSLEVWKRAPPKYWRSATRKRAAKPN